MKIERFILILIITILLSACESKYNCADRIHSEQKDKFNYYVDKFIIASDSGNYELMLSYRDSSKMADYVMKNIHEWTEN